MLTSSLDIYNIFVLEILTVGWFFIFFIVKFFFL